MENDRKGLSSDEANKLLAKYGKNELISVSKTTTFQIFIRQFKNFLVLLLLTAAIISASIGDTLDAVIILLILVLNTILGFFQEFKAENALASLQKMTTTKVRVIRDGHEQLIDSKLLVPGDIVHIAEGDKIPADAIILSSVRFEVNEAALTGESLPVSKSEKQKEKNTVFMGTIVSSGRATIKILHTGDKTKFGEMTTSLSGISKKETPLSSKITKLGKQLSIGALLASAILFIIGILYQHGVVEMLLTSMSLLIAAVPEGLPTIITITLAIGLQRMSRHRAILRKLSAIEALGGTTVIATDKTGTLTENKMKVAEIWVNNKQFTPSSIKDSANNKTIDELISCGVICNASSIKKGKKGNTIILGDQTEGSLLVFAQDIGFDIKKIKKDGTAIDEFSFDSDTKTMSVLWEENGTKTLYTKGAPESILELSTHISVSGKRKKITATDRKEIEKAINQAAENGLRILALSKKDTDKSFSSREKAEKDLTFLGFISIYDPPRLDVYDVIEQTKKAGIQTIMITGDNPLTASYVGKKVGIYSGDECVVTGNQLSEMDDDQLKEKLKSSCIFARTDPKGKYRIVQTLQKMGHTVTVTGDGVNDALALKQADVGVAMGITGTDVAKEVADMVITDDNFVSIVRAVREGRIIFDNIVKSISYLVTSNLGEVLLIIGAILLGFESPLLPVQILWVNLVTDGFPALSLAFDPGSSNIMKKRSTSNQRYILNRSNIPQILEYGALVGIVPLMLYVFIYQLVGIDSARVVAFNTVVMMQMIIIFFLRPGQKLFSNKLFLIAVFTSLALQLLINVVPFLSTVFHISS